MRTVALAFHIGSNSLSGKHTGPRSLSPLNKRDYPRPLTNPKIHPTCYDRISPFHGGDMKDLYSSRFWLVIGFTALAAIAYQRFKPRPVTIISRRYPLPQPSVRIQRDAIPVIPRPVRGPVP